jgi:ATP-binding cassette subfamily B multidrug efflux pump
MITVLIGTLLQLAGPWFLGRVIDEALMPGGDMALLVPLLSIMAMIYLFSSLFTWLQRYIMTSLAQRTIGRLRQEMFEKLQTLSLRYFDTHSHGDVMSRFTNDLDNLNNTMTNSVIQFFSSVLTFFGTIVAMLILNIPLALISLITIPLMAVLTKLIAKRTRNAFRRQQKELGELNGKIEESLNGEREIIAFGRENITVNEFLVTNSRLRRAAQRAQFLSGIVGPLMNMLSNVGYALVAFSGGYLALKGRVSVGNIASFLNYVRQFNRPLNHMAQLYNTIQSALAGAERIFILLDEKVEVVNAPESAELGDIEGHVVFDRVYFSYLEDQPVLKNVSLSAAPGEMIALVGPTGAGKTTIVNLLTRFYDIQRGSLFIDGKDLTREITKESLRSKLAIVLQDTFLFSTTVRENIRYGRLDATDAQVEDAAIVANADHFIRSLPQGYDTLLSGEGSNLSQGQKQLLAIARAVLADPEILILDEATSSVDTRTEKHIQEAMLKIMKGRTSFVIAHRLSTIKEAHRILVIKDGEIVEQGAHGELIALDGVYADLYRTQYREGKAL